MKEQFLIHRLACTRRTFKAYVIDRQFIIGIDHLFRIAPYRFTLTHQNCLCGILSNLLDSAEPPIVYENNSSHQCLLEDVDSMRVVSYASNMDPLISQRWRSHFHDVIPHKKIMFELSELVRI